MAEIVYINPEVKLGLSRNILYSFTLLVIIIFTLIPEHLFSEDSILKEEQYLQLMNIYREWIDLDRDVFKTLSFKLTEFQITMGRTDPKFFLDDNIGRRWMFKPRYIKGNAEKENISFAAIPIRNLYKLFGLYTPSIYIITLNINGRLITGSIQEFINNKGELSYHKPKNISQEIEEYILKAHVIDWVFQNVDAKDEHYLITEVDNKGNPQKITRIDNENILFKDKEDLNINWACFVEDENCNDNYFNDIWKRYLAKEIDLDLDKNFEFIKYFADFPNYFLDEVVLNYTPNDPEQFFMGKSRHQGDHSWYLDYFLRRKLTLIEDFKQFYADLTSKRKTSFNSERRVNYGKITSLLAENIKKDIEHLKSEKIMLEKYPKYFERIDVIFSLEGFNLYEQTLREYKYPIDRGITFKCGDALDKLRKLKTEVFLRSIYEAKAIDEYIRELERILSGEPASVTSRNINKLIKCITPNCIAE